LYKGNILQYKGNSFRLTKRQKYSQIAKCIGPNRTKVFATQTQKYTNPNTTGLLRVNYTEFPFPNEIVGAPNNISGPYQYNVPNPFDCSSNYLQDGGNLVCGSYANPCTGEILKKTIPSATICNPSYCSDVPGTPIELCWNTKIQSWFPKQRYVMNNSTNKWPQGYKEFVSAVKPDAPVLSLDSFTETTVTLSWTYNNNICIPISEFIIYNNNNPIKIVAYTITSITINFLSGNNYFNVTSFTTGIESKYSNTIIFNYGNMSSNFNVGSGSNTGSGSGSNTGSGSGSNTGSGSNVGSGTGSNVGSNSNTGSNVGSNSNTGSNTGSNSNTGSTSNIGSVSNTDFGKCYVIENTNNTDNSINLNNYINNNDTVVTIHNNTGKNLIINSTDLIHNNFFCPDGTNNLELNNKSTARIYNIHIQNNKKRLKQAIIF
jgi:hypothetical protein